MKLLNCHIENFGKLSDITIDFSKDCVVLNRPNGWGKSTLVAFLCTMFYGFGGETKRNGLENERRRYMPWQQGIYGGQVSFDWQGKAYQVVRTFGNREREDTFALYDLETDCLSSQFSSDLGKELFLIDRESFLRTICVTQNDCVTHMTDGVHAKVGNLTMYQDDINQYDVVQKRLNDLLNSLSPQRKTGAIYKKKEEINYLQSEIMQKQVLQENILQVKEALEENQLSLESRKEGQLKINQEMQSQIRCQTQTGKSVKGDKSKIGLFQFNKNIILMEGFILGLALLSVIFWSVWLGIGIAFLGIVVVLICLWRAKSAVNPLEKNDLEMGESSDLLDKLNKQFQQNMEEIEQITKKREELRQRQITLQSAWERLEQKEQQLESSREMLAQLEHKYEVLSDTKRYLTLAKEHLSAAYKNPIMEGFLKYYQLMAGNSEPQEYRMNTNMELMVWEKGNLRELKYFSEGYQDLAGLCMRISLVEAMYQKESPFFIFDDPFSNLDDKKLEAGQRLLRELSKRYQVIYLTCQKGREL